MASLLQSFNVLFCLLAVVFVCVYSSDDKRNSDGRGEDELIPDFQSGYFQVMAERPVVVQSRASRIDCILNMRSFELCRNLLS